MDCNHQENSVTSKEYVNELKKEISELKERINSDRDSLLDKAIDWLMISFIVVAILSNFSQISQYFS
jgi:hypothetical protein